jgi:hypothetical protein
MRLEAGLPLPTKDAPLICSFCEAQNIVFAKGHCLSCYGKMRHREHGKRQRISLLARRFNITTTVVQDLLTAANGQCQICHEKVAILALDHDHQTGKVREFLCHRCNLLLGYLEGMGPSNLLAAVAYLVRHESSGFTSKVQKELSDMTEIDRIGDCEYEELDEAAGDCHGQATHILRDAGLVVCSSHVDGATAIINSHKTRIQEIKQDEPLRQEPIAGSTEASDSKGSEASPVEGERPGIVLPASGVPGSAGASLSDEAAQ